MRNWCDFSRVEGKTLVLGLENIKGDIDFVFYTILPPTENYLLFTGKTINTGSNGTLVSEIPGDTPLVGLSRPPNEGGMEQKAVLGCVGFSLEGSEKKVNNSSLYLTFN